MAEFDIQNRYAERTVHVRMSGLWTESDVAAVLKLYRQRVAYNGQRHMIIADMRGMKPMRPAVAEDFGRFIQSTRRDGVVLCAHISDHTVQRLQAARIVRENSRTDEITVDVATLDEAHRVVAEARARLDDTRDFGSVRDSLTL